MRIDLVLVKLGAVFIVVYALQGLAYQLSFMLGATGAGDMSIAALVFLLVFGLPALIALMLWKFPATTVGSLYANGPESEQGDRREGSDALLIGLTLIGVYTLIFGFIDLVYFETQRFVEQRALRMSDYPPMQMSAQTLAGRVTNVIQIVVGLVLVLGREGIASFLRKTRKAGV